VKLVSNVAQYSAFGTGPITSTGSETMAFVNIDDDSQAPDIQIYCIGLMWPTLTIDKRNAVTLLANLVRPLSYVFSPGIFWSGLIVNRCGCEVQALQMNS
jgi:choline dehydrogenase